MLLYFFVLVVLRALDDELFARFFDAETEPFSDRPNNSAAKLLAILLEINVSLCLDFNVI